MYVPHFSGIPCQCPTCGHCLDTHSNVTGEEAPEPGDFSVCIKCATILRFGEQKILRKANQSDFDDAIQSGVLTRLLKVATSVKMASAGRN
jgi:hypothetical protein